MLFECTQTSLVCHSYVLACHSDVTRMYLYVIRMSVVYTRMSMVCTCQGCHHVKFFGEDGGNFVKSWTTYPGPKFDLMFRLQWYLD